MTHKNDSTALTEAMEQVIEHGMDGLSDAMTILLNEAMKIERSRALQASPWERTEQRLGYANGYKDKVLDTRLGKLQLSIPQVRGDVSFYPSALERGLRSERALLLAMAEMYVKGVSTRKVQDVLQKLCGLEITATQVSRACEKLDQEIEQWRNRPLGCIPFLQLDATYEKVRCDGTVVSSAVLIALRASTWQGSVQSLVSASH
jgi:transposase-like protein